MNESFQYEKLQSIRSFRVVELLPGKAEDEINCVLHQVGWLEQPTFEAISYAWGNPEATKPITVHGKTIQITVNLHTALTHLRYEDCSRFLWVDALCINQKDIPERGAQVLQMRKIYENASTVLIWIGPDNGAGFASQAVEAVRQITRFLCQRLGTSVEELRCKDELYHDVLFKNQNKTPSPDECESISREGWQSLLWLYKSTYFTRVWAIQEITASKHRMAHCGHETIDWVSIELVAGYIILNTDSLAGLDFSSSYCWWASTAPSELRQAKNWLHMLYLASNFVATDPRDVVYGLRGMMYCEEGGHLLNPDYNKTTTEVYRDTVEAGLVNYKTTSALLYVSGVEDPSWIPRWDHPMLFRNPFRFGRSVPWQPAGNSHPVWSIDRSNNILFLSGSIVDSIDISESYNERFFGRAMFSSEKGRRELKQAWQRILRMMALGTSKPPLTREMLTSAALAFSFGLDRMCHPADEQVAFRNFVAYLNTVLDGETYQTYISEEIAEHCAYGDGGAFGKPVWDFEYPSASVFITRGKMVGCAISPTEPGDVIFIPLGGVYPLALRPSNRHFQVRGYCFVHGIMQGQSANSEVVVAEIR